VQQLTTGWGQLYYGRSCLFFVFRSAAGVAEWQTQRTQNPPVEIP
jgi:hypothetical protein